ncbi:MAG: tyrosine--tRNA ligase [Patescibacteria group bacterium]|jgi:tyrosyl-tRNA synthetase|nr:tyrosine--tRNA ligase [Patescibacteria group bacterium]
MSEKDSKIKELLERGVEEIIDKENLEKKLKSGKTLRVKLGIDPTSPNLHLGRSIPLLKLRDFQELGHQIVFIVGDFTGVIGDTSDKESERPMLEQEVIEENLKTYKKQAGKIIDLTKAEVRRNSEWLGKLGYFEIGKQADVFSLNHFASRENISKRMSAGKRVSLRELLYPLMQGYDSVAIKADVEIGGTDQRFNLLSGRDLQKFYNQEPQDIITNPLIEGLDGKKMSSSIGNTINFLDTPQDIFGKIMSLNDELIIRYFTLLTRVNMEKVKEHQNALEKGENPRDIKIKLAHEVVNFYHSKEEADKAEEYFVKTFSEREVPTDIPEFKPKQYDIISILTESGLVSSKSEGRRVVSQKGVKVNGKIIEEINYTVERNSVIQKGKINFLKVV